MTKELLIMGACLFGSFAAAAAEPRGAVCFTFDDYHGAEWLEAAPLFRKYGAHATFFVVGEITPEKAGVMKKLQAAGHTVGLHSLHHCDAVPFIHEHSAEEYLRTEIMPQLDACARYGLTIRSFAYPNNRRDEAADRMLFPYFDHLRAGRGPEKKTLYYPLATLPEKCPLGGTGIGSYYNSELAVLKEEIAHAAETDSVLVFFSHNIGPAGRIGRIDMPAEWLEELLAYARSLNVRLVGFEELNGLRTRGK